MTTKRIVFGSARDELALSPIRREWILEGNPIARKKNLSSSADGTASTFVWDCTAGRFNWHYQVDETICVLEGAVTITDLAGGARTLEVGDTAFFPAGSNAEWRVDGYVRKIAFLRTPLTAQAILARRVTGKLRHIITGGNGKRSNAGPSI